MASHTQSVSRASAATAAAHHPVPNGPIGPIASTAEATTSAAAAAAANSQVFAKENSEHTVTAALDNIRAQILLDLTPFARMRNSEIEQSEFFQAIIAKMHLESHQVCINHLRNRCTMSNCRRQHVDLIRNSSNAMLQQTQTYKQLAAEAKSLGKYVCLNFLRQRCDKQVCKYHHAVAGDVERLAAASGTMTYPVQLVAMPLGAEAATFSAAAASHANGSAAASQHGVPHKQHRHQSARFTFQQNGNGGGAAGYAGGAVASTDQQAMLAAQYNAMLARHLAQQQHAEAGGAQYQLAGGQFAAGGGMYQVPLHAHHGYPNGQPLVPVYTQQEPFMSPAPALPDSTVSAAPVTETYTLTEKPNASKSALQVTPGSAFNKPHAG
jgi:hypothetical protein